MAPLPPTPKITEISCVNAETFVPFVEGWEQDTCPVEVGVDDFYASITFKGENLTTEWLQKSIKGAYLNHGDEIESTLGEFGDHEDGRFSVDFIFNTVWGEGDAIEFDIDGVKSAWMPTLKAN